MTGISADHIVGCILAGGRSTRMRQDKASMELCGRTLLERAADRLRPQVGHLVINANVGSHVHGGLGSSVIADTIPGHAGPLAGILAGLRHAETVEGATHVATAPVDAPFFPRDLVARLSGALSGPSDVALAESAGRLHPVFAVWPVGIADELETWLHGTTDFSVRAWISRCTARTVEFSFDGRADPFFNVNTPSDLEEAARILRNGA